MIANNLLSRWPNEPMDDPYAPCLMLMRIVADCGPLWPQAIITAIGPAAAAGSNEALLQAFAGLAKVGNRVAVGAPAMQLSYCWKDFSLVRIRDSVPTAFRAFKVFFRILYRLHRGSFIFHKFIRRLLLGRSRVA